MEIVRLVEGPSLNDIPGQLRALADRIEAGEYGLPELAVFFLETDEGLTGFSWGHYDSYRAIGMMAVATQHMIDSK